MHRETDQRDMLFQQALSIFHLFLRDIDIDRVEGRSAIRAFLFQLGLIGLDVVLRHVDGEPGQSQPQDQYKSEYQTHGLSFQFSALAAMLRMHSLCVVQ